MPRIARPTTPALERARSQFQAYLTDEGLSVNAFAKRHGVTQSTVHRFVHGATKTISPRVKQILDYAGIDFQIRITDGQSHAQIDPLSDPTLQAALRSLAQTHSHGVALLIGIVQGLDSALRQHPQ